MATEESLDAFLEELGPKGRAELDLVLASPSHVRADAIRQLSQRPEGRDVADLLIELEVNDFARAAVLDRLYRWSV